MNSRPTTFAGLFSHDLGNPMSIACVEIPMIQRDYAQGRRGAREQRIRDEFVDVLRSALTDGPPVHLDFVYGKVTNHILHPLDGQQRLTTLFLLHWYLASRANRLSEGGKWKKFTYATRPGARLFCERIVQYPLPLTASCPSEWLQDQAWFLYTWCHDPSIQAMLVMLDSLHERFSGDDCEKAWQRLASEDRPAISFHLLPIEKFDLSDDLYIKMNSRGKQLTDFEVFKARIEQILEKSCPARAHEFSLKIDGVWTDILWKYRGEDTAIDDELLRYFFFVIELCEWRVSPCFEAAPEQSYSRLPLERRAARVFGAEHPHAMECIDFLFHAFDVWVDMDVEAAFQNYFIPESATPEVDRVLLFHTQEASELNLFSACCESYGNVEGRNREFSLPQAVFLYAVLLHQIHGTDDFSRRMRVLRNLVEASANELRAGRMPAIIADVRLIIQEGTLTGVGGLNQAQVREEQLKDAFLEDHPALIGPLTRLEDHPLLRGSLVAFDLEVSAFESRVRAFEQLFDKVEHLPDLTGALLAQGDYSRHLSSKRILFGSSHDRSVWRQLFTGEKRDEMANTRRCLQGLLDRLTASDNSIMSTLEQVQEDWLEQEAESGAFDWRHYFIRYSGMRGGKSGIYVSPDGKLGYELCMLMKHQLNSKYRDPFLFAIYYACDCPPDVENPWFTGYETVPRWMTLKKSGVRVRCVTTGFILAPPREGSSCAHDAAFKRVCSELQIGENLMMSIPQVEQNGTLVDQTDRVEEGAMLLKALLGAGL